ncbi:hypothetical protein S7711_02659 [Stachybotrys chartarum IBT 7711]|uniref:LysM domain-containing protein n=1 Tax=Stachybotrys chartarum (strain CBS 109288 / IBT 7711) TaxID=1280523 RepID=A0A084B941_STACB|nr:hypothetical protein S7711_02659 [Stachybotrys chartarum IBT 7711]
MHARLSFLAVAGLATYHRVWAQQLPFNKYQYDTLGLSSDCADALNTTVECSDLLGRHAGEVFVLPAQSRDLWLFLKESMSTDKGLFDSEVMLTPLDLENLESMCTAECRSSLESLRAIVLGACDAEEDVMVFDRHAYPATFNIDRYLHALDVTCHRDSDTGTFCDLLVAEWRNETNATDSNDCHDCMLEPWRIQLESPLGYDDEFAEDFSSVTESCGASGYSYSTPTAYGTPVSPTNSETSTSTAEPTPCATPYTVGEGDTCETIAAAHNVSSFGLIDRNGLDIFCHLPDAGGEICLPAQCRTHFLLINDNCRTLSRQYNVTRVQLVSWNSNFDPQCLFIERWRYTTVCVSPPGGRLDLEPPPEPTQGPTPPNAHPDSNERCASWYTVVEGDYCDRIANDASLTTGDFYFLNQGLDESCSNLELGTAYCVRPVGDITTYPGYQVEGPSTSFTRPPTSTISVTIPTESLRPRAPGTLDSCATYVNAVNTRVMEEMFGLRPWYAEANRCQSFAAEYGVSIADLREWNPSLSEEECRFELDYSYCVAKTLPASTTLAPTSSSSTTASTGGISSTTSPEVPENTQPGTIEHCRRFHLVGENDGACDGIIALYGLRRDDFFEWNPEVGDNCTALWLGYYVCIGV